MAKKKTLQIKKTVEKIVEKVKEKVQEQVGPVATERVNDFKEYLKIENPLWFQSISYSVNTVIDRYRQRTGNVISKPEYRAFVQALAEHDSNFK